MAISNDAPVEGGERLRTSREETGVYRIDDGEVAQVTPAGPDAALIWSRGFLPLRVRTTGAQYLRAAFPGTAVRLGDEHYEVIAEVESAEGVVYRLRRWPEGEVVRNGVAYGPRLVRAAQAERARASARERFRPYRFLLLPLVGLLPEPEQERWADRLGLYAVTATCVSGLCEAFLWLVAVWLASQAGEGGLRVVIALAAPCLSFCVVAGVSRAFSAAAFHQTSGQFLVAAGYAVARDLGRAATPRDQTLVPLTRAAFWSRLEVEDQVTTEADGALVFRGLLPHLSWLSGRRLDAGNAYWLVETLPTALDRSRLVYGYHLEPLREFALGPTPRPLPASAYADEVWAEVRREWDDLLTAFTWLASALPLDVQRRAFDASGGPAAARRSTLVTAVVGFVFAIYVFAQRVAPGDPVGPWMRLVALGLIVDGVLRIVRTRRGEYAPSLFRWALPSNVLRPERVAYQAHRDAERAALASLKGRG